MAANFTIAQIDEQLEVWRVASARLAKGQTFTISGRQLTLADVNQVQSMINYWTRMKVSVQASANNSPDPFRGVTVIPVVD